MEIKDSHTRVLIVGAGPSGLMMAAQMLRYGVLPIVIDSKKGPTHHSNALALQARSLEIYRQMGIADTILRNCKHAEGLSLHIDGKDLADFSLADAGSGQTAFPYLALYEQHKNERLLLGNLTQNCCPVYWETTLVSLTQADNSVRVQLQSAYHTSTLACDWVIGADGAHSTVRKLLDIPFKGDTYADKFYLADVKLGNLELNGSSVQLYLHNQALAAFFPLPDEKSFRIIGNIPQHLQDKEPLALEDVLPSLDHLTGSSQQVLENHWFATYRLHHRMADKFRQQRLFLIGDAAHIHSPVGGQGMNTGLQDAYNLAWKLAGVIKGQFNELILDSYQGERMPVARELLNTTDRVFKSLLSDRWPIRLFKRWLMPAILKTAWRKKQWRTFFFKRISQIHIHYRNAALSLHLSQSSLVKAGDRLPYLKVYDEKKEEETDLYAWCSKPGFTLIILGKFDELLLFNLARWITGKYAGLLNFFYLPPSGKNLDVFDAFQANPHGQKAIIVRPDLHIGLMSDIVDIALMDNYLLNIIGITAAL